MKIIRIGYILISIIICIIWNRWVYEWNELERLDIENKQIDISRQEIHKAYIHLIEFSLSGETILEWDDEDLEHYHAQRIALDSLLCCFKSTYSAERIDSVRSLLEDKERQMFQIVRLMDEQQSINKKIASQAPVIVQRIVQEQPKKPKRKGFLGIFGKKEETKPTTTTTTLRSPNRSIVSEQKEQSRRLSEQADSLAARNADLNRQLKGLICQIENKVQADLQGREDEIIAMREKSFMQVGGLMGFVLLLLLISYIIIHRDAKSIKRYKRKTTDLIGQLEQSVQQNKALIASRKKAVHTITHELRTPLTLIISPLEGMLKETTDELQSTRLQLMYRNAQRLLHLVNQLLDFRKGEMSTHQLSLSEGDIISYVHSVCNSFLLMADKKHIQFSFFSGIDTFSMAFDADKVGKIVMNLLSNAFKFTPEGGRVTVMIEHVTGTPDTLEIKIADTGIGISDVDKEHIFDRFYQADHKGVEETTGNGIGLSLVRDFVTLHEGEVKVFDNIGTGSVFVIQFPVKHVETQVQLPEETGMSVGDEEDREMKEEVREETGRKDFPLLLVVDDNEDFRIFMRYSLELQYRVKLAVNGNEAWEMMQEELPDLVISDVMMPQMDGNELCRLIKQDCAYPCDFADSAAEYRSKVGGIADRSGRLCNKAVQYDYPCVAYP